MEHDQLTSRLRRLGEAPVPGDVADAHLSAIAGVRPQRRLGRVGLVAAAAVLALALATVPTGLLASSGGDHTDLATDVAEAQDGEGQHGRGRGPCHGPPPWAGSPPVGETEEERDANRQAEVEARRAAREAAGCPPGEDGERGGPPPWAGPRGDRGGCGGPPPWAGQDPDGEPDEERAAADREEQVRQWRIEQAECRAARAAERAEQGRPGHGGPFVDRGPCQGPPPWAGGPPAGETDEEREANRQAEADAWRAEREAAGCPADEDD